MLKYIILITSIIVLSSNMAFSAKKNDCSVFKKFSMKYTWCKSKNAGNSLKTKVSNLKKNKNK